MLPGIPDHFNTIPDYSSMTGFFFSINFASHRTLNCHERLVFKPCGMVGQKEGNPQDQEPVDRECDFVAGYNGCCGDHPYKLK
jgi:hypothetical protein